MSQLATTTHRSQALNPRLLTYRQVQQLTGLSRTTLWRLCVEKRFPLPIVIDSRTVRFRAGEVDAFCCGTWQPAPAAAQGVEQ